jgi:phosphotriesterase-related protein
VEPSALGPTNYHEHLFQATPLLQGEDLDDETRSGQEASFLRDSGFAAMVDATPLGLGRQPEALARIAGRVGMKIVATTGRHREEHYPPHHWVRSLSVADLEARFLAELTTALPVADTLRGEGPAMSEAGAAVRAGVVKAGIGYWSISAFERQTLEALACAHRETGAPVMVHLEHCSSAHELLDLLISLEVSSTSVVLAHADRSLDPGLHLSLIERGAYLGYDGMGRLKTQSDEALLALTQAVVEGGGSDSLVLGGDVARRTRYVAYGGIPGLGYLGNRYLPRLRERIGEKTVEKMLTENPATWLTWP